MTNLSKLSGGGEPLLDKKPTSRRGRPKSTTKDHPDQFYRNLLYISDDKLAESMVQQEAEARANELYPEFHSVSLEKAELDHQYDASLKRINKLEAQITATPRKIKNNQSDRGENGKPFLRWKRSDQVGMFLLSLALVCALVTGASNAFVALYSSGSAIFIDQPWIAILISLLVPTGGVALKFITNFLHYDLTKKRFAIGVNAITILLLLSWSIVFASEFAAASGGMDWENLGESSGKSNLLNWLQLTSELMLATCLSLAIESIYTKYRPDGEIDNPEFSYVSEDLMLHRKSHEALKEKKKSIDDAYENLHHLRTSMVLHAVVAFQALQARYEQAKNF